MSNKPIIFISYAHSDEPERPADGEVKWLSFVQRYLQPAVKHGVFDLWVDRHMTGGADWDPVIEEKLRSCDVFILLVSPNAMASHYIIDKEIAIIRERQRTGDDVHFYPLLLTPTPRAGLAKVADKNLRPRDAKPLSGFLLPDRMQHMSDAADEIGTVAEQIAARKASAKPAVTTRAAPPSTVHISGLPETGYETLVGRDTELKRLDAAWQNPGTNILSLVAEGGAGKSALVNEWLTRLRAENYRGATMVLGWSFYSQGTKERATAADGFLTWALERLGVAVAGTSAAAKGEAIAEALMHRRVLLLLDGVEPLQHGFEAQPGQLKDQGLRALLRRFAATPPAQAHGLIVLTTRLAITDISTWKAGAAPVEPVEHLSDEAGAALLRDNGVWGTDLQLREATRDFGGHPLALGLLASFLAETQNGDIRRRDHIRAFLAAADNPRHDHARRVMESYEREWLAGHPALLAVLRMVGLFDRPASGDCLDALRAAPAIPGLTDGIVGLHDDAWHRAVARLRAVRLLAPADPTAPETLDAHPLIREWFGESLRRADEPAWRAAHGRLYEYLRDTTQEGSTPTLDDLAPLYQAVAHGCRAGRHREVLDDVYSDRICRRNPGINVEFYAIKKLGAFGSDLATISWFFDQPYSMPIETLTAADRSWVLGVAGFALRALGRFAEALPALRAALRMAEDASYWRNAAVRASNLSETECLVGEVATAVATADHALVLADRSGDDFQIIANRTTKAEALQAAGDREEVQNLFIDAEQRQRTRSPSFPFLTSVGGFRYCDLLLSSGDYNAARDRATETIKVAQRHHWLLDIALDKLTLGRADIGSVLEAIVNQQSTEMTPKAACAAGASLDHAVEGLRAAGQIDDLPRGLLARVALRRSLGDWEGAWRDLDEVLEIAEPGPMKLFLCDRALEIARLALARREGFAPLNGFVDDGPPKPPLPDATEASRLCEEAREALSTAGALIAACGYHRRDAELAELDEVMAGGRRFADLPPRV